MRKIITKISCMFMVFMLSACASNNNVPVELRVQDGYIQYDNGTGWTNLISTEELKGEQGIQGEKGEKGDKGDKGDPGINGLNGTDGTHGINGKDGTNGVDGKDGIDGVDGVNGIDGTDGKDAENPITKTINISTAFTDSQKITSDICWLKVSSADNATVSSDENNSIQIYINENGSVTLNAVSTQYIFDYKFIGWNDGVKEAERVITYDNDDLIAYFSDNEDDAYIDLPSYIQYYDTPEEYIEKLNKIGLTNHTVNYFLFDYESLNGKIMRAYGTNSQRGRVYPDSKVYITAYKCDLDVKDFTGKPLDDFLEWYEKTYLNYYNYDISYQISPNTENNIIISQEPSSGTIKKSEKIKIVVSGEVD